VTGIGKLVLVLLVNEIRTILNASELESEVMSGVVCYDVLF